jgi:hypothetical protein
MGRAAQHSGGQLRFGLSATVASAVLYSAVVLLGLGPASPSAQGREIDRTTPVVRVPRDRAVSAPARRLPQVSRGPARRHSRHAGRGHGVRVTAVASAPLGATDGGRGSTTPPRTPEAKPKTASSSTSVVQPNAPAPPAAPSEPDPVVTVPDLTVTVPELPVTVPDLPLKPPPIQVPTVPALPLP